MKRLLILLLCALLIMPMGLRQGIVFSFLLQQEQIAKLLCVERAKPITRCHGRCYLDKQLRSYLPLQETEASSGDEIAFKQLVFILSQTVGPRLPPGQQQSLEGVAIHRYYPDPPHSGIFRPPIAA